MYTFWKSLLILVIFSEKEYTLKLLFSIEIIIVRIESWVDFQVRLLANFSTNFAIPMFRALITYSTLMVQGASLDQLKELEGICNKYLEQIKLARGDDKPKTQVFEKLEIRVPSPDDDVNKIKVGILMKKPIRPGEKAVKPTFAPCEITFNRYTMVIEWVTESDGKNFKDKVKKSKPISNIDRTIEVEMDVVGKKVFQFPDVKSFEKWGNLLSANLTRTFIGGKFPKFY